jgi:hypothetical protein
MITVIENRCTLNGGHQDFVEGIFNTRREAEAYFSKHPAREVCRILELPFDRYPFAVVEIDHEKESNNGSAFRYFQSDRDLDRYLVTLDIPALLAKQKAWIEESGLTPHADELDYQCLFAINVIHEQTVSAEMNLDPMGGFDHYHIYSPDLERAQKRGKYGILRRRIKEIRKRGKEIAFWLRTMPLRKYIKTIFPHSPLLRLFSCTKYYDCRESVCDQCMEKYLS